MLLRCDDPDHNCATQDGWAGHWRGSNATQETVICPLSFAARRHLDAICRLGYTVAKSALNTYWAVDLMHRVFHVSRISEGAVEHYADDHASVLELEQTESKKSVVDSDTLQYFAIEAWALDIAVPGVECLGAAPPTTSTTPLVVPTSMVSANMQPFATTTSSAPSSCHTHANEETHCT